MARVWNGTDVEDPPRAAAWLNELERQAYGGSLPSVLTSVTRDAFGRVTAYTDDTGSYTSTYSTTTGLIGTVSNATTTRTISRDSFGRVTGVT